MRAKTLLLIIGIVLIAGFAVLNVNEFTRTSTLNFGFGTMQLPLGLVMLVLTLALMLIFLVTTLYMHSANLIENKRHSKELSAQRELADKAEASRFTELRKFIDAQSATNFERQTLATAAFHDQLMQTQSAVIHRLDQSDNTTAAYMGQMQDSMERRNLPNVS